MKTIWMPLPDHDFDTTEVAVPWKLLTRAGHRVVFTTENGAVGGAPACDPRLIDGVLFGKLGADPEALAFYRELAETAAFTQPTSWRDFDVSTADALFLPGGHAPGMKQYLGSKELADKVAAFWALPEKRPVGAICHGVLVLARAQNSDGKSLLEGRRTTCLPKYMERSAWLLTAWKLGRYYRTYPAYVEEEVRAAVGATGAFVRGARTLTKRGSEADDRAAFVVEDGNYVSARWPGDAYLIAKKMIERLG